MSDPLIFTTPDGVDIESINGVVTMSDGLESAIALSLDGNSDDPGKADKSKSWWGNLTSQHPHERLRSEFLGLVDGAPITSGGLRRLEEAAGRDLAWLTEPGPTGVRLADSVALSVTSPERNTVLLDGGVVTINGKAYPFTHKGKHA